MRLHSVLLASGALSAAVHRSDDTASYDCLLSNPREMASDAHCGDVHGLTHCFSHLASSDPSAVVDCYVQAGCSPEEALGRAAAVEARCVDLFPGDAELRRRSPEAELPPATTTMDPYLAATDIAGGLLFARSAATGEECFVTSSKSTRVCDVKTEGGDAVTESCSSTQVPVSECAPGKTCSLDRSGTNVCMDLQNSLDIAGIIVAIVFGTFIVLGVATLTWLCCKDRKEQKRMAAKAEATALKRAATKKKKAEAREQRAPLMAEQRKRDPSTGGPDPFSDRNTS